jgi:GT2 family glycosyltransferase
MDELSLARDLVALRPDPAPAEGPVVSMVITNRNGAHHLTRLLDGLRTRTRYRSIELVLVDNGSTDDSLRVLDRWDGRKVVVANQKNQSFSAANNAGIRVANGELVLLANNDIDPIHPDWLGYLVESLSDEVAAVGAMLIYPARPRRDVPYDHPDLTVQHLGMRFAPGPLGIRAFNDHAGSEPLAVARPGRRDVPAVTAACLLARRADLLETLLDEEYDYGSEDWDLCLRLGDLGRVVIDERAVLFHHEFGTQEKDSDELSVARRSRNHKWFNGLWGPSLMRAVRTELAGPPTSWFYRGDRPPHLHLIGAKDGRGVRVGTQLRRECEAAGWRVTSGRPGSDCDIVVALRPPNWSGWFGHQNASVGIVLDRADEWVEGGRLDATQVVVTPDRMIAARLDALWGPGIVKVRPDLNPRGSPVLPAILGLVEPRDSVLRIGVSTCAPDRDRAAYWGDTHLARGLMRSFRRLGHESVELIHEDWHGLRAASCDVVVHLRGLGRRTVGRGQWNILWIISHPDRVDPDEYDDYDIVASASRSHAEQLAATLGREVHYLPQATDSDTFKLGPTSPDFADSVLYVGNARWPHRRAPRWLARIGRNFDLYGKNWEGVPEARYLRGDYIENREVPVAYRSAAVVVADHHGSMRTKGFVANRLFDVLASGGLVLSDDVAGLSELFGDLVPTYANPEQLDAQLERLLGDAALRRGLSSRGRAVVESQHTLDHRARRLLQILDQL